MNENREYFSHVKARARSDMTNRLNKPLDTLQFTDDFLDICAEECLVHGPVKPVHKRDPIACLSSLRENIKRGLSMKPSSWTILSEIYREQHTSVPSRKYRKRKKRKSFTSSAMVGTLLRRSLTMRKADETFSCRHRELN